MFGPQWFVSKGIKFELEQLDVQNECVSLRASAARVGIARRASPEFPVRTGWLVKVEIVHSMPDEIDSVNRIFEDGELAEAFYTYWDRRDSSANSSGGAIFTMQGKFVRQGDFLNIPCAGPGHQRIPIVSIYLTNEIKEAVAQLLSAK